jgi:hypothetical protein
MPEKRAPLGICDQCGRPIPQLEWFTSKGGPRLHCSPECRATANSRAGAPIRSKNRKPGSHAASGSIQPVHRPDPVNVAAGISWSRKLEFGPLVAPDTDVCIGPNWENDASVRERYIIPVLIREDVLLRQISICFLLLAL